MFYWPHCELTDFEKKFVSLYKEDGKPGVLRRTYRVILNALADSSVIGFDVPRTEQVLQISRRSRVFGLSFAGDTAAWRLRISNAAGTDYTPINVGAPQVPSAFPDISGVQYPIVASMCPGSIYSLLSSMTPPPPSVVIADEQELGLGSEFQLPLILDPNWQLVPNESLVFQGFPIREGQAVLEIAVHVWEFPGMENCEDKGER